MALLRGARLPPSPRPHRGISTDSFRDCLCVCALKPLPPPHFCCGDGERERRASPVQLVGWVHVFMEYRRHFRKCLHGPKCWLRRKGVCVCVAGCLLARRRGNQMCRLCADCVHVCATALFFFWPVCFPLPEQASCRNIALSNSPW